MKKRGFTLIELLVVIAIIAMLMAILMPALGRVKRLAQRIVDASHVRGMGQGTLIYAQENDDEFPISGGRGTDQWTTLQAPTYNPQQSDYWDKPDFDWTGQQDMTIGSCLYLLIRYADLSPGLFICPSSDETEFEGLDSNGDGPEEDETEIVEMWDFGDKPVLHYSYAYQNPFFQTNFPVNPLNGSSASGMAVFADKNPWYDADLTESASVPPDDEDYKLYVTLINLSNSSNTNSWDSVPKEEIETGNSGNHLREGQNVVYMDNHTSFERRSDVGVENDNIYTFQPPQNAPGFSVQDKRQGWGEGDSSTGGISATDQDNNLVNDEERANH